MRVAAFFALMATLASLGQAGASIFDDDSSFMQGFETGVMMRSKAGKIEDYGCSIPEDRKDKFKNTIDQVEGALGTVRNFIPEDNDRLANDFDMVLEFVRSMGDFMMVFSPDSSEFLDDYCKGMIFGLHGWSLLVRVANQIRNQEQSYEVQRPGAKKGKKKGGSFDLLSSLKDVGGEVLSKVAQEMVNRGANEGDL